MKMPIYKYMNGERKRGYYGQDRCGHVGISSYIRGVSYSEGNEGSGCVRERSGVVRGEGCAGAY